MLDNLAIGEGTDVCMAMDAKAFACYKEVFLVGVERDMFAQLVPSMFKCCFDGDKFVESVLQVVPVEHCQ
jgi:hypothetical protein